MAILTPSPRIQFFDANGNPLVGGKLYTYYSGTTTPQATYTDSTGSVSNANPVILDSRGEASVWLGTSLYYMELKDSLDTLIWTADNVGGGATIASLSASSGASLIGFIQSGTGAVARTVQDKSREIVSVKDFGAVGDGITDDTSAINTALAVGGNLYFPRGTYKVTGTLTISVTGTCLTGDGRGLTTISSTATGHTILVNTGLSYIEIHDMTVTRTGVAAVTGQDGIHFTNLTERALISDVEITNHWDGLRCGITSYSKVIRVLCNNNYQHGVHVTNADGAGGLQWTFEQCLSQQSDGYGLLIETSTGAASVGEILNFSTYANKLGGAKFLGSAPNPLQAIRWKGGFVGEDGGDEINIDTYATSTHTIQNVFIELAGVSANGVNLTNPATNVGRGITCTANNTEVQITGCNILGNSYSGIKTDSPRTQITGCNLRINGAAAVAGEVSGIYLSAGNATVVGNSSKAQSYGIFINVDGGIVTGNDFTENTVASTGAGLVLSTSVVDNNLGGIIGASIYPPIQITLANGLNSNISRTNGIYSYVKITGPTGVFSIGGFTGGASGQELKLYNTTSQAMTIVSEDASSTAANRISTLTGGNVTLRAGTSFASFIYDGATSRWILTSTN